MKQPVVIIGLGEMAGVFARGFLKLGHPVYPVLREHDLSQVAVDIPEPALVLLAVGEKDLQAALSDIPEQWKSRLCLLQNELLPRDWEQQGLGQPTVISVWFEKKPGQDFKVLVPSPVFGPKAQIIEQALETLGIPVDVVSDADTLLFELVRKNMYIVTTNVCGLRSGGTVNELWQNHTILMNRVFDDILQIQQQLTGKTFNRDHLLDSVLTAFEGDPEHKCMGRSAPARLQRALDQAREFGITTDQLNSIAADNPS